jgi:hypothetical protein
MSPFAGCASVSPLTGYVRAVTERAGSIPASSTPEELRGIILQTRTEVEATIQEFGLQQE